jgi:hypothetical protein
MKSNYQPFADSLRYNAKRDITQKIDKFNTCVFLPDAQLSDFID